MVAGTLSRLTLFGDLPALLSWLRRRAERTQAEAAQNAGLSNSAVSRYENGETVPDVDTLDRLLVFYGVADLRQLQEEIDALRAGAPLPARPPEPNSAEARTARLEHHLVEVLLELRDARRELDQLRDARSSASAPNDPDTSPR
jgi:transcriptional regulator with XRE-family HTH domain